MSSFSALKTAIQAAIKQNGNNEITGDILQDILLSIVSTLGDSAINNLETGLQTESQTRGNDDAALSQAIENEATARGNQDTQLGNLIIGIKNNIDNGYVYAGIATPSTTPVSGKVFYIATQAGTYTNLGNTAVKPGISILKYNGSAWSNEQVIYTDGGVFDVSAYNGGATYASLEALLSDANLSTIIPSAVRKGGMTIRYVQTSDNKYVQYRLIADSWSTNTENWAIADEGVYVENSDFVYVKTDAGGKILWAIRTNGSIYYGAGVPQQVIDYIEEKIAGFSPDEYENIVAFLADLEKGDDTLQDLLDKKVDGEYVENPEYIEIKTDTENKILEATEKDGTKVFCSNVKLLGNIEVSGVLYEVIENSEYLAAWVDAEGKVLFGLKTDGKTYIGDADFLNSIKNNKEAINEIKSYLADNLDIDALSSITAVENPEFVEVKTDSEGKIISYRKADGTKVENIGIESKSVTTNSLTLSEEGMTEFQKALIDSGFSTKSVVDWSDAKSIELPTPRCAIVNITNADNDAIWPTAKGVNLQYYIEFWDMQGNYFKKEVIMNAQGQSSMLFEKKNGALDLCNNNGWDDDDTFSIKFGDWIAQDSFHVKAYHTDFIRGGAVVTYQIADEVYKTRGVYADRPWKKALIDFDEISYVTPEGLSEEGIDDIDLQIDNGARCMPDGFPAIFYLNGEFYGIYSWQLKKHKDNYHMNKKVAEHVHLDGEMGTVELFGGTVRWGYFEIRNPKNLVYATAQNGSFKYDADVIQAEIAGTDKNYDGTWVAGSYAIGRVVLHNNNYFINQVADNTATPITKDSSGNKNTADNPDFKNKTGCGWINCTNSVKVKEYIINLSNRVGEINTLDTTDSAAAKALFDTYFDADNCIDYQLINMSVDAIDSYRKNWQWITYDGVKWWVCQYDKDQSFGNFFVGDHTRDNNTGWGNSSTSNPIGLALKYYKAEHIARWNELKSLGIFTAEHIKSKVSEWVARVGVENYRKEWKKWPEAPCNRDSNIDFENWVFTGVYTAAVPEANDIWDEDTEYVSGATVYFNSNNPTNNHYLQFRALKNNINKPCLKSTYSVYPKSMGYRDSIWRYYKFIEKNIYDRDNFINSQN